MSIVTTEVESIHGAVGGQRTIWYRCLDHLGEWHAHGPIVTHDDTFDADAYKTTVAAKVETALALAEFDDVLEGVE